MSVSFFNDFYIQIEFNKYTIFSLPVDEFRALLSEKQSVHFIKAKES